MQLNFPHIHLGTYENPNKFMSYINKLFMTTCITSQEAKIHFFTSKEHSLCMKLVVDKSIATIIFIYLLKEKIKSATKF